MQDLWGKKKKRKTRELSDSPKLCLFKHQHNFLKSAQFQDISDSVLQSTRCQLNIPQKATARTKDKSCALTAFHLTKDINHSPQGSMPQGWDYTALHHLSECCNETSGLPSLPS